jgi:TetR/AcrR family transcriptional repressor of bet genes
MMPLDKSESAAPAKAGEKLSRVRQRQKLVDACISALYQHGPSRTTIDKVVSIADMSPGIVNFYFETKAALLVAALDYLAEEFEDRVLAPLAALRDDPVQALRRLIDLYLDPDIASPRKVSVWYAFWGEASSRSEYYLICGKRDEAFADLVRDLVERLIRQNGAVHLDADAIALGLIGALEMIWQEIAFHDEGELDRVAARLRCVAYLRSIFPAQFGVAGGPEFTAATAPIEVSPVSVPAPVSRDDGDFRDNSCAMLVAAELTLAGVPAMRMADLWPGYNVLAQRPNAAPQRILVRGLAAGTGNVLVDDKAAAQFDWLAIVLLPDAKNARRRIFIIPGKLAREMQVFRCENVEHRCAAYENNFNL